MKKQVLNQVNALADGVGQFIRYWGFRKIHGQIWALVYLSSEPLSGIEMGQTLGVSKALISPALKELEAEGLIKQIPSENAKTKRYIAEEDVMAIIHGVLKRREIPMLLKIQKSYDVLAQKAVPGDGIDLNRMQSVGLMIQMAQLGLVGLLDSENLWGD